MVQHNSDWNTRDFVLSADSQFNGGPDFIHDIEEYRRVFNSFQSEYQVVVSPSLDGILGVNRKYEPINNADEACHVRIAGTAIAGLPAEFYQSHIQKPEWYVDFKSRTGEVGALVRERCDQINWMYGQAFAQNETSLDEFVGQSVESIFGDVDPEMKGILRGYLTQKPIRSIVYFDIEPVNELDAGAISRDQGWYFNWLESTVSVLRGTLAEYGIPCAVNVSGKGYHVLTSVPLFENGHYNDAMFDLMEIGGHIQPGTMAHLATLLPGTKRISPVPILSQRAYQGCCRLSQFVVANIIDSVRHDLDNRGLPPHVGLTDNNPFQIAFDLTSMLRQVNMSCFGSPGSLYNKSFKNLVVRIPRSRGWTDFFGDDIGLMLSTRTDAEAVKAHLINSGCQIPDAGSGMRGLIRDYKQSRLKRELWDGLQRNYDPGFVQELVYSNYEQYRRRCPVIGSVLDSRDPGHLLDPKNLDFVYHAMARAGASPWEMVHLTMALYQDPVKSVDMGTFYSSTERTNWVPLLLSENFKD